MKKREVREPKQEQPQAREKIIIMPILLVIVAVISVKIEHSPKLSLYIFMITAQMLFLTYYVFFNGSIIHDILSAAFIISLVAYPLVILDSFNTALSGTFIVGSVVNLIVSLILYIALGMGFFRKFVTGRDACHLVMKSAMTSVAILLTVFFIYLHSIYLKA